MKSTKHMPLIGAVLLAAITSLTPSLAAAPADPPARAAAVASPRPYPFRGTIARVDLEARTVTLEGRTQQRVLRLEDASVLEKDGRSAAIGDIQKGEYLRGQVRKNPEGHETIVKAVAGPRPSKEAPVPAADAPGGGE